ncbi:SRPBCC family protein [Lascolabacillus massiliensis]|uniref:SRPBCC family protein n=1 Tax=Lascolabacillus massiliensis TaxID=1627894 RepID=UPI001E2E89E5|nr:SRPBCC domain-containing protein [Lascolabacillus massiliensis]
MLDQWWGPKPWRAITKSLDFREGGHWHYLMNGPEGEVQWGKFDYLTIEPNESFTGKDGFSDENGTLDTTLPQNHWELRMSQTGNTVMVDMLLTFEKAEDIDTYIDMGFKEGITQTLDQLEEIL